MMEVPSNIKDAIFKAFPYDHDDILARIQYSHGLGCWHFDYKGMFVGVEDDGYIHT